MKSEETKAFYSDSVPLKYLDRPAKEPGPLLDRSVSICNECERATRGHCPWAERFEPHPGWTATKKEMKTGYLTWETYKVHACPRFAPTWEKIRIVNRKTGKAKTLLVRRYPQKPERYQPEGVISLLAAVIKASREDYIISPKERPKIKRWIYRQNYLSNPDCVLQEWDEAARIFKLHPERKEQLLMGISDEEWAKRQEKNRLEKLRGVWIIFNAGTPDAFAECSSCGHEHPMTKHFPRRCPACQTLMKRCVKEEEYGRFEEDAGSHGQAAAD